MSELGPTNTFVRDYTSSKKLTVESFDEKREWGGYYILALGPNYDVKILWVRPRQLLSLQSHGDAVSPGHHEVWTALTNIRVIRGQTVDALTIIDRTPGGIVTIAGGFMHSLANPFKEDHVYVYEVRVSSAMETSKEREDRIKRIYDKYERGATPPYPEKLLHDIMERPFDPRVNDP
jgi:hypothetical protein